MSKLQQQLKDFRREGRVAIEATERKFAVQIEAMDASLVQKDEEVCIDGSLCLSVCLSVCQRSIFL